VNAPNRYMHLEVEFVEFLPEQLESGKLYISRRYSTASHLCCCGCGLEVVTPLNAAKWYFTEAKGTVSLYPSIGNWSFPCRSHYWIIDGNVRWASEMSPELIAIIKKRDRQDAEINIYRKRRFDTFRHRANMIWAGLTRLIQRWFRIEKH
jgi:hypothetical protein